MATYRKHNTQDCCVRGSGLPSYICYGYNFVVQLPVKSWSSPLEQDSPRPLEARAAKQSASFHSATLQYPSQGCLCHLRPHVGAAGLGTTFDGCLLERRGSHPRSTGMCPHQCLRVVPWRCGFVLHYQSPYSTRTPASPRALSHARYCSCVSLLPASSTLVNLTSAPPATACTSPSTSDTSRS